MSYLGNAPARSFISFERQVFTIVNSQTAYALSHSVTNENDIRLVVNNVVQEPGSGKAYTATGTALTLSAALTNGTDEMYCVFLGRATATSAPGAGSIGTTQLAADAVTNAKIADDAISDEQLDPTVITGQTAEATIATDDTILIHDTSASALRKMTRANFVSGIGGTNTPAFEAYTTGLQSISENSYVKMTFATEVFDTDGNYASDRFTPQTAGKYFVYAKGTADPAAYENGRTAILKIYKNGSNLEYTKYDTMTGGNSSADGFTSATPSARAVVDMNGSSDYLEAYFLLNTWNDSGAQVGSKQFGAYRIIT